VPVSIAVGAMCPHSLNHGTETTVFSEAEQNQGVYQILAQSRSLEQPFQ